LKAATFRYFILALCYFVGRIGFTASPDVFNKTRPNRHINTNQDPVALIIKNTTSITVKKFKPKQLHFQKNKISSFQFIIEQFNKELTFQKYFPYAGSYIDPPPLIV